MTYVSGLGSGAARKVAEATVEKIEPLIRAINKEQKDTVQKQAEAFNRVAAALEALTEEVRGLRHDLLTPELSKEKIKLPGAKPRP